MVKKPKAQNAGDEPKKRKLKRKSRASDESEESARDTDEEFVAPSPKKVKAKGGAASPKAAAQPRKDAKAKAEAAPGPDLDAILGSKKTALSGLSFKKRKAPEGSSAQTEAVSGPPTVENATPSMVAPNAVPLEPVGKGSAAPVSAVAARRQRQEERLSNAQQEPSPPSGSPPSTAKQSIPLPPRPVTGPPVSSKPSGSSTEAAKESNFHVPRARWHIPPAYKSKPWDPDQPNTDGVPKKLEYKSQPWTAEEIDALKGALKKYGIPAPASDSLRKDGLWYSSVAKWGRIAGEIPGRSAAEARFQFFGIMDQAL